MVTVGDIYQSKKKIVCAAILGDQVIESSFINLLLQVNIPYDMINSLFMVALNSLVVVFENACP